MHIVGYYNHDGFEPLFTIDCSADDATKIVIELTKLSKELSQHVNAQHKKYYDWLQANPEPVGPSKPVLRSTGDDWRAYNKARDEFKVQRDTYLRVKAQINSEIFQKSATVDHPYAQYIKTSVTYDSKEVPMESFKL